MFNVKLDENNYFTGSYAKVGKVAGGIDVPTLPPETDKATLYKWEQRMESVPIQKPVLGEDGLPTYEQVPVMDEETQTQAVDVEGHPIFTNGEQIFETVTEQVLSPFKWWLDDSKPIQEEKKEELLQQLKEYKWEKLTYITYNNHLQRYEEKDKMLMLETQELLEKKYVTSVNWIHSDGAVVPVSDAQYIINMRLTGGKYVEAGFNAEIALVQKISSFKTMKDLDGFNLQSEFDTLYMEELNKMFPTE